MAFEGSEQQQMLEYPQNSQQEKEVQKKLTLEDFALSGDQKKELDSAERFEEGTITQNNVKEKVMTIQSKIYSFEQIIDNLLESLTEKRNEIKKLENDPLIKKQLMTRQVVDYDYIKAKEEEIRLLNSLFFWAGVDSSYSKKGFEAIAQLLDVNQANLNRDAVFQGMKEMQEWQKNTLKGYVDDIHNIMKQRNEESKQLIVAVKELVVNQNKGTVAILNRLNNAPQKQRQESTFDSDSMSDDVEEDFEEPDSNDLWIAHTNDDVLRHIQTKYKKGCPRHKMKEPDGMKKEDFKKAIDALVKQGKLLEKGVMIIPKEEFGTSV